MSSGNWLITIAPLVSMVFTLGFSLLGLWVLYLIIRTAINNSKLSQNIEALRSELREINSQLRSINTSSTKNNDSESN
jgi:uncharacterized membrane protein YciS (DUF1049 family)